MKSQSLFCIQNNQGFGVCYQPQPSGSADNTYLALIILDIIGLRSWRDFKRDCFLQFGVEASRGLVRSRVHRPSVNASKRGMRQDAVITFYSNFV